MKILKDSIFKIGKAHSVCQDYAESWSNPFDTIAISDGCSSSPNTDFGSRILVSKYWPNIDLEKYLRRCVDVITSISSKDFSCLDATLLTAFINNENLLKARILGDGVFSYLLIDGTTKIVKIEYANNAPYYPLYEYFKLRKENYLQIFGGQKTITEYTVQNGKLINTEVKVVQYNECNEYEFNINDLKSFFLFSDGVETFHQVIKTETSKFTKDIPTVDSVLEIMNCPTFGPFLEKKYTKMSEQHAKQGIFHSDDLSVAAFLFHEDL